MTEHMVWFKMKEGVSEERKSAMLASLRRLPGQIDGIAKLACGEDFSGRSRGFQVGLSVTFVSPEALAAYGPHPVHEAFIAEFKADWEEVTALDFNDR